MSAMSNLQEEVMIIAEAGVNHNGQLDMARNLVDVALGAKADVVKFQLFDADDLASQSAPKASYQEVNDINSTSQIDMLRTLQLSRSEFKLLNNYCQDKQIEFCSTAFDIENLEVLVNLGMKRIKIASGEITNIPFLRKVGQFSLPIILSTGMCSLADIDLGLNELVRGGAKRDDITILHCCTAYPTPLADANVRAMQTIQTEFGVKVGFSDHTEGYDAAVAAVSLGATIIEKHFTLSRHLNGPDHRASLEPWQLAEYVKTIRNTQVALGKSKKEPTESEKMNMIAARRSIVASKQIKAGQIMDATNLTVKRPGDGICASQWDEVVGTRAKMDFSTDQLIET